MDKKERCRSLLENNDLIVETLGLSVDEYTLKKADSYNLYIESNDALLMIRVNGHSNSTTIKMSMNMYSDDYELFNYYEYQVFKALENLIPNVLDYSTHLVDFYKEVKSENEIVDLKGYNHRCTYIMKTELRQVDNESKLMDRFDLIIDLLFKRDLNKSVTNKEKETLKKSMLFCNNDGFMKMNQLCFDSLINKKNKYYKVFDDLRAYGVLCFDDNGDFTSDAKEILKLNYKI